MHCKECKHWTRYKSPTPNSKLPLDECIYGSEEYGRCKNENFIYLYGREHHNKALIYWDCDQFKADFETGEQFGCIHFEQKE